ncbi:thiamine pyrophosphate-binding protein [Marivita sp. S6314]|uniref:thiamine pyrophosphate-binding protein n=1 Tax=Marivita sp. S6314 TaxID=2926406 RepID=UPI001FF6328C|nr:thiamine pyrophosphate-binding protein [Marivita sp. S6314]MCK0149267.1 thiamine pyrophosphate-binding protein [Marivita sp. S6314]
MRRGADHVMQVLAARGVTDIFALSGNQIMPLFDAALDAGLRLVHTRHEAATVYMAEAYAQISGKPGIALVTAGAGLGNAIGPLLSARASDTPLVLLSGDSPAALDGAGAFQEMDQIALTASLTKWSVRVTQADALADTLDQALRVAASGRPGPVHVCLPADVLTAEAGAPLLPEVAAEHAPVDTAALSAWMAEADRPLVVLGPALNATRAPGLATRLEAALDAPVICMESPRGANDPALGAVSAVLEQADRILLLGKPLDFTLKRGAAAPRARWAVVNADQDELDRAFRNVATRLELSILQDPSALALSLAGGTSPLSRHAWRADVQSHIAKRTDASGEGTAISPPDMCRAIQEVMTSAPNPVLVCDGGEIGQWAQAGLTAPRRIINGVSGAIGGGLCYAMAAKAADPTATVFAVMGDGTVGFHLAEFETAVRENLPFIAIVGNDQRWNAEHQIQMRDFGADRVHACGLSTARYDAAVTALGGFGAYVTTLDQLTDALQAAIASQKPACINVRIEGLAAPVVT